MIGMGFGLRDEDWVDPDEEPVPHRRCGECENWVQCECGSCGYGWCIENGEHTYTDDDCYRF